MPRKTTARGPTLLSGALLALVCQLAPSAAPAQKTETFELDVRVYCRPPLGLGGTVCGEPDQATLAARMIRNVEELNLRFCANGMTFRPTPTSPQIILDTYYSTVSKANGGIEPDPSTFGGARVKELRDAVWNDPAARKREHVFVLQDLAGSGFASVPPNNPKAYPSEWIGSFIAPGFGGGAWAHEMGHHFGLAHTFSFEDRAEVPGAPDRDQDDLACTAEDPGVEEVYLDASMNDRSGGVLRDDHELCDRQVLLLPPSSEPRPKPDYCSVQCIENVGGIPGFLPITPPISNAMTAYGDACHGPYELAGTAYPAFCNDQTAVVKAIRSTIPERQDLVAVCPDGFEDSDCDGICQDVDNCPDTPNTAQTDTDMDGNGDACDVCWQDADPLQEDWDGDGVPDACDGDIDDDCCLNAFDANDYDPTIVTGYVEEINCPGNVTLRSHRCADPDNDGILGCEEGDSDGDGVDDILDECPFDKGAVHRAQCTTFELCAGTEWWFDCNFLGTGCLELVLKLYEVVNPAPTEVVFQRFEIVNRALFIQAAPGGSVADLADLMLGANAGELGESGGTGAGPGAPPSSEWRLEIWTRDDRGLPRDFVSLVASFVPAEVEVHDVELGDWLQVDPPVTQPMQLAGTWGPGLRPGEVPGDVDEDGLPSFRDNCSEVANADQADRDRDQFGDACDADLDGDQWVNARDLALVEACLGVDLRVPDRSPDEGDQASGASEPPVPAEEWQEWQRRDRCRHVDLDGDGRIDDRDLGLVQEALGSFPGPSGQAEITLYRTPALGLPGLGALAALLLVAGL